MIIDSIEIYRVEMPLVYPFRTAFSNAHSIGSVLVKVSADDRFGWGEASPWSTPGYSPECAQSVFLMVHDFLGPMVLGHEVRSGAELQALMSPVKGNFFAKAALDLAWWDARARTENTPLHRLLGGERDTVEVGADFGVMESVDLLIETIHKAVAEGFKRVKLKYRPGWEIDMIQRVRETFPDTVFHVDCNSAYTLEDVAMLTALDPFDLAMVEQPLMHDDLIDHATLQKQLRTPICLDESITSPAKARKAIQIGACGWINIKPGRVGGLTPALEIHDLCREAGIPCWVGGMLESSVGSHHCLALATLPNFVYPNDIFPTDRFFHEDLATPPMQMAGPSLMRLPQVPGCGAVPDPARLRELTVEQAVLPAETKGSR